MQTKMLHGLKSVFCVLLSLLLAGAARVRAHSGCAYVDCYTYPGDACCTDGSDGWAIAATIIAVFFILLGVGFCVWALVDKPTIGRHEQQHRRDY
jgi:hypothetical protein